MSTIEEFAGAWAELRRLATAMGGVEMDDDLGYRLTCFPVPVVLRIRDVGGPAVGIEAIAATSVVESVRLYTELRDFAVELPFGRVRLYHGAVALCGEVRLSGAEPDDLLRAACASLAGAGARLSDRLAALPAARRITLP